MYDQLMSVAAAFSGGVLTGCLNFFGLWLTVKRVVRSRRPSLLVVISMLLRLAACMAFFYLLMDHSWQRLLAVMAGFFMVRLILFRQTAAVKMKTLFSDNM